MTPVQRDESGVRRADRRACAQGLGYRPSRDGSNPFAAVEPRISANLSNQFEWPLFFHLACLLQPVPSTAALLLAWAFIAGRLLHSAVQIFTANVRLRGLVFMLNFLAVLGLWGLLVVDAFG